MPTCEGFHDVNFHPPSNLSIVAKRTVLAAARQASKRVTQAYNVGKAVAPIEDPARLE